MTAGVRMLPCFPCVGDGADYGTFGPQGPSASVAQRRGEVHRLSFKAKGKGYRFGDSQFQSQTMKTHRFAGSST